MSIRILLADDHRLVREGLRALIQGQPDMEVVAEVEDGRAAIQIARDLSPEIVVMDIGMRDLNGIDATRKIKAEFPHIKVIGLSMHSDRRFVSGMLGAGASGYLLKDSAFEELVTALHTVRSNKIYLSPSITGVVVEDYVRKISKDTEPDSSVLTGREREVLQLLAEGNSTKEIASHLNVSVKTVETYRKHIMEKLDLHSIADLTKYAIRSGLTSLED